MNPLQTLEITQNLPPMARWCKDLFLIAKAHEDGGGVDGNSDGDGVTRVIQGIHYSCAWRRPS